MALQLYKYMSEKQTILLHMQVIRGHASLEKYTAYILKSKKISNDQELIQSDPISCPQNQREITKYIN